MIQNIDHELIYIKCIFQVVTLSQDAFYRELNGQVCMLLRANPWGGGGLKNSGGKAKKFTLLAK